MVEPQFNPTGDIIGAIQVTANPSVVEITEENTQAEAVAQTVGIALAEIVNMMRNKHRQHVEVLQMNQQEFEERLAAAERRRNEEERERARQRPRLPELKMDPPDYYEGDPTEIDAWLRKMAYYFVQVRLVDPMQQIAYAIQRIRKGPGNRATNWSNSKIVEVDAYEKELNAFYARFPGRTCTVGEVQTMVPEVAATDEHPLWPIYEFIHKPPFDTWEQFVDKCCQYFLTTETRDHVVSQLWKCQQGNRMIEEYIIKFQGWANLAGFDEIALVDQFKKGIKIALGRKIMELGSPGDGSTPAHLEAWYN